MSDTPKKTTSEELFSVLDGQGIASCYGRNKKPMTLPFAVVLGAGQQQTFCDNTVFSKKNNYTVEYYFAEKSAEKEDALESAFLQNGFIYGKSDDTYIETENVFVIYYTVWRKQYE